VRTYKSSCKNTSTRAHTGTDTQSHTRTPTYSQTHTSTHKHVHTHTHTHTHTHNYKHAHTRRHTYSHVHETHTHTHTHTCSRTFLVCSHDAAPPFYDDGGHGRSWRSAKSYDDGCGRAQWSYGKLDTLFDRAYVCDDYDIMVMLDSGCPDALQTRV
jgi:hypothetical protein